ncbi:MAG: leucine-rich repeat domain-containing protein [Nostoc sp. EfeVER01]|uniref:leucine-rich repeat domain-containing protein n=1 Tax=unclassified Nostoc TaxID=2593658 RepID=UPI002AD4DD00|nr:MULTISPECIES: leucine-rich repeat domain-containing protein [unclassified Nostoc]MDZ7948385.1 leucine-rich repeat domain-containing protein [Nostoc sp. EfeVER01]MDZ7991329.1 leucine-rich repeat domain-containing protein [Nostoc sp. EspVER01]
MARDRAYWEAEQCIEQARQEGAIELDLSNMELTALPEAIASLTQLQKLNLSHNQLSELPEAIASLTQLQRLYLDNNQLTELPEVIASLTQLQKLNLSHNQLSELPEAIASLTQLQRLYLDNNQLTELPEAIASLTQLQQLNLSNNRLTQLPEAIASLTQLQQLYLDNNQLTTLPEAIASLTQLQKLNLSDNQLSELPEAIASLTQLQTLNLSNNQLTALPEAIASLTQLQQLYLSNNELTQLPKAIASLTQLQNLDLSSNNLTVLPEALASLTQLQNLDLSSNNLTVLPEAIAFLNQLYELNLSSNQLTELPESIKNLTKLTSLSFSENKFVSFPNVITSLEGLRELYAINNKIEQLPNEIGNLTQLRKLYLGGKRISSYQIFIANIHGNHLTSLPHSFTKLTQLVELNLDQNPLNAELAAAYEQGLDAVLQYLRAKAEEQLTLNEAKLILIGEGEVGKSCLLGALREDKWVDDRPTTHGIEIKPVTVTAPDSGIEITLNGWDFGGQRVYRPTHQLFFSAPAVYLVVWKPREGPQQGFVKEWITLIKNREPDAKVLVVATHGGPGQRQPDINRQEILDQFGKDTVIDFFHIDSKPNQDTTHCTGLAELKDTIARVAASLPEMGRSVPAKWQRVRETLQTSDKAYLPYDDVIAICAEQGIDDEQAELFLRISHILGHFIHYHYDPTLRDIVILKPDWLAKAISFVLDDETTRKRNGLVEFEHLGQLWSHPPFAGEEGYPSKLHPIFLRLMKRFDLSYKVVFDPSETSNTSLIAQLVPDTRPERLPNWEEQPEAGDRQQVQICRIVDSRGQFAVAEGLFYQLIVRLHKYSLGRANYENSIHWQRGLMLDNDYNGRALLEYVGTDVKITVRAAYPERFLSYLTEEIKWLVENFWEGLRCNVMVPCIETCGMNAPGNGLFEVQKLIESKKKNRHEFPCPISGCGEWQNIDQLLNNAPTAQPPSQEIGIEQFRYIVKDELNVIRKDLVMYDRLDQARFQVLSQEQRTILSQVDQQFAELMQMLTDEAKDGPRLFSFKPIDPKFFDRPKWMSAKFQLTLWCEHARQPLPALNPNDKKKGVYELDLPREWFTKAVPYLRILTGTLSLVLPVAGSATKFILDDTTYKAIEEQLDLGQKSIESTLKGSDMALAGKSKSDASFLEGDAIRAQGSILRELHALLKEKDPSFGGLVRVQNKRREFLWVHPQFVDEY